MSTQAPPPVQGATDSVSLVLPDDPSAPSCARQLVREVLPRWHLAGLVDDAELVVSELVTNALRHGLPPVVLTVWRLPVGLRIDVRDERPSLAFHDLPMHSLEGDESGRGRGIVEHVSDHCGVDESSESSKTAYAAWDRVPPVAADDLPH